MDSVTRTLGDICDEVGGIIRTGPFGTQLHRTDYQDEGTPVVMPKDIVDGKISTKSIARVGQNHVNRLSQHKLEEGDIVFGRRGEIGSHALVTKREFGWLCGTGCLRISLGHSVLYPPFLHYYLSQPKVVNWIRNHAIGATMPNLNTKIIRSIPVTYPSIEIQQKIAGVVSPYDDLVENNTQRIRILEDMAQTLYREWFINFRFPGHENAKMTESESGIIPSEWETKSITEVSYFRFIKENISRFNGQKEYFATANIVGTEIVKPGILYEFENKPSRAKKQPLTYSVWFARMKETYKVLGFTEANENLARYSILSSGFAGFQSKKEHFGFLYNLVKSKEFHELKDTYCTGATQMALTNDGLSRISIVLPPEDLIARYSKTANPIIDQCLILRTANTNLRQTRDLLIPPIFSGEIEVNELDINIPSD